MPPPSTPTPWRFRVPNRATGPSPIPSATAPRFQSTQKFGGLSTARSAEKKTRGTGPEDIEEDEDEIHESPLEDEGMNEGDEAEGVSKGSGDAIALLGTEKARAGASAHGPADPISSNSTPGESQVRISPGPSPGRTSPETHEGLHSAAEGSTWRRTPFLQRRGNKRLKVEVSNLSDASPSSDMDMDPATELDNADAPSPMEAGSQQHSGDEAEDEVDTETLREQQRGEGREKEPHQPTFNAPPRFKPIEAETEIEGLPIAFSPQRRGAKYMPGGLAAELQGWLSEVKGWEGAEGSRADTSARVTVEEVRPGRRMYLVRARLLGDEDGDDSIQRRFVLAGEGRLTGLGQRAEVSVGKIVVVAQPVWDVELDGELWIVACDWFAE